MKFLASPQAIVAMLNRVSPWLAKAFSDNGSPSSSRVLTAVHSSIACAALAFVVLKTRALPDGTVLAGLGAFATAHYAVNRASNAWGKPNAPKPDAPDATQPPPQPPTGG